MIVRGGLQLGPEDSTFCQMASGCLHNEVRRKRNGKCHLFLVKLMLLQHSLKSSRSLSLQAGGDETWSSGLINYQYNIENSSSCCYECIWVTIHLIGENFRQVLLWWSVKENQWHCDLWWPECQWFKRGAQLMSLSGKKHLKSSFMFTSICWLASNLKTKKPSSWDDLLVNVQNPGMNNLWQFTAAVDICHILTQFCLVSLFSS